MSTLDDLILFWKANNLTEHKCYATDFSIEEAAAELAALRERIAELVKACEVHNDGYELLEKYYEELKAERTWQPIETIPDRTTILVWDNLSKSWMVTSSISGFIVGSKQATHWMPLPEPPKEDK